MKKIIGIMAFFFGLGLVLSFVLGYALPLKVELSKSSVMGYRLLESFAYFFRFLPPLILTGFLIGFSVHFGRNAEGSTSRFSKAMFGRYKQVLIFSLVSVFILLLSCEVFVPLIMRRQNFIVNQPRLINDYVKVANQLFDNGYYNRAQNYADEALKLAPDSKEAMKIKDKVEAEISRLNSSNMRFKLFEQDLRESKTEKLELSPESLSNVYENYQRALKAYEQQQWFDAHYYAGLAQTFASPKDPNLDAIKMLQTDAWNRLSEYHSLNKSKEQTIFDKKYEGYLALVQKNDLKAYYIFNDLINSSRELSTDPDVTFYHDLAERRVKEKFFFIDETFELKTFENANDIYFALDYMDGSKDIVYFKGMNSVKATGNSIQYLRNLTITSIDDKGNMVRKMTVPYAKVLPVAVKDLPPAAKELMDIDEKIEFVPYLMLYSVGRNTPDLQVRPVYTYENGIASSGPSFTILPLDYTDLIMLENSAADPNLLSLVSLYKLIKKADMYGFSSEVYTNVFLNRIFYAIWILIVFVLMASIAWNTRIGATEYFKMTWIFIFPVIIFVCGLLYEGSLYVYKLINYALVSFFGSATSVLVAALVYVFIFIASSIYFMGRRSQV